MESSRKYALAVAVVVFVILLAIPAYLSVVYYRTDVSLTDQVVTQQETLADLSARALEAKLDQLVAIASRMASSSPLTSDMSGSNWSAAATYVQNISNNVNFYDPYIDRIVIVDANAIQQAAYPELSGSIGTNAASSSWYRALRSGGSTAISNVVRRAATPQIQVVNIAARVTSAGNTVGFVVLQISNDHFLQFEQAVSLGTYGFAYIVDTNGNVVAHPRYSSDTGDVVNLMSEPAVAAVTQGGQGVVTEAIGGEPSVVAYKQVANYGWGIVTQEPYNEAFGTRDAILSSYCWEIAFALLIDLLISYVIFRVIRRRGGNRAASRAGKSSRGFTLIELLVVIAIIAILSVVVILSLNPAELLRQSRDSDRISDMATLKSALSLYMVDAQSPNLAATSTGYSACYLSTTSGNGTTSANCGVFTNTYTSNGSTSAGAYRKIDSSGWLPVNFSSLSYGSPFGALPVDPLNTSSSYYAYAATSSGNYYFEINAFLESIKYKANLTTDGGNNPNTYEVGTQPGLNL